MTCLATPCHGNDDVCAAANRSAVGRSFSRSRHQRFGLSSRSRFGLYAERAFRRARLSGGALRLESFFVAGFFVLFAGISSDPSGRGRGQFVNGPPPASSTAPLPPR